MDWTLEDRPRLRDDLLVEEDADSGATQLSDPISQNVHQLSPIAAFIARQLDGRRPLADILGHMQTQGLDIDEDEILDFVRALDVQSMLITPDIEQRLQALVEDRIQMSHASMGIFRLYRGSIDIPEDAIEIRDDLRFSCLGCGTCCTQRFIVQLLPSDVERLRALDLSKLGLTHDEVIRSRVMPGSDVSTPNKYLAQGDGACIFLGPDKLCEIHRHYGYEHKPMACRVFPFYPVKTPRGALIQFRPESSQHHTTRLTGPRVAERKAQIWQEIAPEFEAMLAIPERFPLVRDDELIDFDSYRELEASWLEHIRNQDWRASLAFMAQTMQRGEVKPMAFAAAQVELYQRMRSLQKHAFKEGLRSIFVHLLGDFDPALPPSLLISYGIAPPDLEPEVIQDLRPLGRIVADGLPEVDVVGQPLFREYMLNFVSSRVMFHGLTVASGLGLMSLVLAGARRTASYASAYLERDVDASMVQESLIAWHQFLCNREVTRTWLMLALGQHTEWLLASFE